MRATRSVLVKITVILLCIGIVMIYSSSSIYALKHLDNSAYFLLRHVVYILIGLVLTLAIMAIDYHRLQQHSKAIMLVSLLLLCLVVIPGVGKEVGGAQRWFRFFGFSFQPSEIAKLGFVVYLADFLSRKQNKIKDLLHGFAPAMIITGVFALTILLQPDLGTAVVIVVIGFSMLFLGGAKLQHLVTTGLLSLPIFYALIWRSPYRRLRIISFWNPWADPQGSGFQLIQSQIALGSGGIFGVGLGKSMQKLFYLPAAHTDFIFSIIGEEFGLVGTLSVVMLFLLFLWYIAKIIRKAPDSFGYFVSCGIFIMLAFESIVNLGVATGSLPTKGLPLPFISYGGSSLVVAMISVGLLLNISRGREA
ncbi:putative lipid II flippase FtsW [Candidatus Omnitrophota bacterium]